MTDRRPISDDAADERIRAWLDDRPVMAPRSFVDATMAPVPAMAQRRRSLVAIGRMRIPVATLARFGALAAVLVVLVIGVLAVFRPAAGPGGIPGASPLPSATTTASVPLPGDVSYTNNGPLGAGSGSEPARAGTYQTRLLRPAVRFTVPEGWSVTSLVSTFIGGSESATGLPLSNGLGGIVITIPTSVEPPAPGDPGAPVPADLFAWLLANPNLDLGPAIDVAIGGIAGRSVEGSLSGAASIDAVDGAYRVVDDLPILPRQRFRLAVVVVDGRQVLVASMANASEFDAFAPLAAGIIATIEFPDR